MTFHLFPRLKPELRLEVWDAIMEPRLVDIRISDRTGTPVTRAQTLQVLHVNCESRKHALLKYKAIFMSYDVETNLAR